MSAFDDLLAQLLMQQIGEIDGEIKKSLLTWIQYCVWNTAPPLVRILVLELMKELYYLVFSYLVVTEHIK
jgi:hypothetical protein